MSAQTLKLVLKVWRQKNSTAPGKFETYKVHSIDVNSSFLEMLDVVNENLTKDGKDPISFDHDCREGICGTCGAIVNGFAHGHKAETTLCQLHMREFSDGDTIVIEPFRAKPFSVMKDLMVDRTSFDRIISAGGYNTVKTGGAQDANAILIPKVDADMAMEAAACIGCGACVAACPNASAMLFTSAKVSHLSHVPQGQPERYSRVKKMIDQMDSEGFGNCSNEYECESACPKGITVENIARMNKDYLKASLCK